jgi:hypothetical protein
LARAISPQIRRPFLYIIDGLFVIMKYSARSHASTYNYQYRPAYTNPSIKTENEKKKSEKVKSEAASDEKEHTIVAQIGDTDASKVKYLYHPGLNKINFFHYLVF